MLLLLACTPSDSGKTDTGPEVVDTETTDTDTTDTETTETDPGTTETDTGTVPATLLSIAIEPPSIDFETTRGEQALLVTGTWSDGWVTDIGADCGWSVDLPEVALVADLVLVPLDVGAATVSCEVDGVAGSMTASVAAIAPAINGDLAFNEVLADPPADADPNGDGLSDPTEDEFVELVNRGRTTVDLGGYSLWDEGNDTARHSFPVPTVLHPGEALVVFGGGDPSGVVATNCTAAAAVNADDPLLLGLALNNDGDTVTLQDSYGGVITTMSYDGSIEDASNVLSPEIDGADWTHHAYVSGSVGATSPCTLADGGAFPEPADRL